MLTFMWTCRSSWCYAHAGWGGGGMGWDVNVHVNLQMMMILMLLMMMMWWWWWWCDDDDDVMMMTLMKLVISAAKFRHGIDKFYQPNSGLRSSKTRDEAIYTYQLIYRWIYLYCQPFSTIDMSSNLAFTTWTPRSGGVWGSPWGFHSDVGGAGTNWIVEISPWDLWDTKNWDWNIVELFEAAKFIRSRRWLQQK